MASDYLFHLIGCRVSFLTFHINGSISKMPISAVQDIANTLHPYQPLYLIQAVNLEISMVIGMGDANMSKLALPYLDSDIKADVIRCAIPVADASKYTNDEIDIRHFLSQHHPDPEIREANFDHGLVAWNKSYAEQT